MKKIVSILMVTALLVLGMVALTSCGDEHAHTFAEKWSSDAENHWHAATCEHTDEISEKAAHEWNAGEITTAPTCVDGVKTYTCTVCNATKTEKADKTAEHTYAGGELVYVVEDGKVYSKAVCDVCEGVASDKVEVANATIVNTAEEAQAALDATDTGVIYLNASINYGTLYLRVDPQTDREVVVGNWAGGHNMYFREVNGVTITGVKGATLDNVKVEAREYTASGNQHSNSETYPILRGFISIKDLAFEGITFSGKEIAIDITGNIAVDGLTFNKCEIKDATGENVRLIYRSGKTYSYTDDTTGEVFITTSVKNITVNECIIGSIYQGLELRQTENVTITNNTFKGVEKQNILLTVDGGTYAGTITISGNTATNLGERFLRATGLGDATVTITNNTVNKYAGADSDYIKITGANSEKTTVEGNTVTPLDWNRGELTITVQ